MPKLLLFITLLCFALADGPGNLQAEDWPGWRGPQRNGISSEQSGWSSDTWLEEKPIWTASFGEGSSSPVVVDDKLYTIGWRDGRDSLYCVDAITGKQLWQQSFEAPRFGRKARGDQGMYSGPSSTPEFDAKSKLLFTLGCDGELRCWNTSKNGQPVWRRNLYDDFDPPQRQRVERSSQRDFGFTSSPLVYKDWLIVEVGGQAGTLVGFDKTTGKKLWQSQATHPAGHTGGPVLMTIENTPCVAVHNYEGLLVVRLDRNHVGQTVAEYPWKTTFANNIATPAVHKNNVVMTSAYNQYKTSRLQIDLAGNVKEIWTVEEASKVCSPVIHKGNIYLAWQKVYCLDFETGKKRWTGSRVGNPGSIIVTSDDRLIVWGGNGTLVLAESATRSPGKFAELKGFKRLSNTDAWPHVALSNGRLYCKDRSGRVICFRVGA